jgi:hypothetical protein
MPSSNQFAQSEIPGRLVLRTGHECISGMIDPALDPLIEVIPGQALKLVDVSSPIPVYTPVLADTDEVDGFVPYSLRKNSYRAGDSLEVAREGYMTMVASGALAVDSKVMVVVASKKVALATTGKNIVGRNLDKALADGDIVRVEIKLPGATA